MAIVTRSPAGVSWGLFQGLLRSPIEAGKRLLRWLFDTDAWRKRMRALREAWPRFRASRLALLVFLCGTFFLWVPSQTRDLMAKLADQTWETRWFVLSVFFWSFSLWYWARWSLTLTCGRASGARPISLPWIGLELPRWLAVGAALTAALAFLRGAGLRPAFFLCLLGAGVVYALCYYRSKLPRAWALSRLLNRDQEWLARAPDGLSPRDGSYAGRWLPHRIAMDLEALSLIHI